MKRYIIHAVRYVTSVAILVTSVFVGVGVWRRYEDKPWTRDGHVLADVVKISPDVQGMVTSVDVVDNQFVRKGDLLFVVDTPRYEDAVANSDAAIDNAQAVLGQARRVVVRDEALGNLVATEVFEEDQAKVRTAEAALHQAMALKRTAMLNLARTEIRASVDGYVVNLSLRPGDRLSAGAQAMALIDASSYRVEAYLEETKLKYVHVGDTATIKLMGEDTPLTGHVESITGGIADDQRRAASNQLPAINPSFDWVRLAQRIPVRVQIEHVPSNVQLIMGRTATVVFSPREHG
ncbi:HlyD family secretion protein [Paraburkholderia sp. C35]|uniref:efflux RND transporter periplasmic adaptor subunit n=1 Tax=Paraburkholderia sp. C35 TaxID=2126993 RepID=UPI000D69CC7B|nr:HlyD family secretion protein [Paraburkholderia sp. C35]